MRGTTKVALGGVLGAVAVLLMMGTVLPVGAYAFPAMAGMMLIPIIVEIGVKWAWLTYAAVGLLSLLLAPDPVARLALVGFFGYYPCYKVVVERLPAPAAWALKLGLVCGVLAAAYGLLLVVAALPEDAFEFFGVNLPWLFFALALVGFVLYDRFLGQLTHLYATTLRKRLRR